MEVEMDVSGVHHHHHHNQQDMSSQTLESMLACNKAQQDKKPRPPEEALKCPRCDSSNTKFCYYNNYSLTQPRYFCKSCRRYWTKGGTLRNVPVGGGCRKNKRSSSSSSSATSSNSSTSSALSKIRVPQDHQLIQQQHQLNMMTSNSNNHLLSGLGAHLPYDSTCTDLSLAFARLQSQANGHLGYDHFDHNDPNSNHPLTPQGNHLGFLDAIRGGFLENNNTPNGFHNNMLYGGGNIGNGSLMGLNNGNNSISNHDEDQEILNHQMFDDNNQEVPLINNSNSSCATTAVTMATVKQETCNMMRSSDQLGMLENRPGVLWGIPWQMGAGGGDQGNLMIHEVESGGRSQIGGWNGIGSTNWHGLINSPLM